MLLRDLKATKCKTCGEPLDLNLAQNGVVKCAICGSSFTLPKADASQKVLDFLSQGEHDLDTGKFEDAYTAFSKACELDKTEPEAYWGMALAEFKIQYLKDEVNNRLQPICHDVSDNVFSDGVNFLKATRYATEAQRAEYERRAEEINYIKNEFYKIESSGTKYDCFICVKVTDDKGGRTVDYKHADDIYFELKGKGYKPFFSERELIGVTGADYEARILYALKSAECMLVVCFDEAYLRTKWVKNEYTRFLKLVNDEEKESDSIALVFGNRPIEKLPGKKGKIQGIALNSLTAMERIVSFVDNHTPEARKLRDQLLHQKEEEAQKKAKENEALRTQLAEQEERFRQQEERFKQLEEMLKANKVAQQAEEKSANKEKETKAKGKKKKTKVEENSVQEQAEAVRTPDGFEISGDVLVKYSGDAAEVTVPDGIKKIGNRAFENCAVQKVTIPGSVTEIGERAFSKCGNLSYISLPYNISMLGKGAFEVCSSLKEITLPSLLGNIPEAAFFNCTALTKVYNIQKIRSIGEQAFANCKSLESFTIPRSVTSIGYQAFAYCDSMKKIIIPSSVGIMSYNVFFGCRNLTIYCRMEKKYAPSRWNEKWNVKDFKTFGGRHKVVWNYQGE